MISQMGSIMMEKAAIGSLDKYLQLKCIQISENSKGLEDSLGK